MMAENYGSSFTRQFGHIPNNVWIGALSGLTPDRIKIGIERMAKDLRYEEFPPKAIAFRRLCLPTSDELGLPSYAEAYQQAYGISTEKHPAVTYMLRHFVDAFDLKTKPEKESKPLFEKAWAKTIEFVANGGELPEPEKQIEETGIPVSREVKQANLNALKEFLA